MSTQDLDAALLIIGAEVLGGKVDDQNGPFLIRALRQRGIRLQEIRVVDDAVDVICDAVQTLAPRVSWLFTTGGIGPTHDDVTIAAVAKAVNQPVVHHPELVARLEARYGEAKGPNLRLAEVPQGAELITAEDSIVPALKYDNIFIFPGVPSLMRLCFAQVEHLLGTSPLFSKALFLDLGESALADLLTQVQQDIPQVAIGSYPRFDEPTYRVKVTVDGRDEGQVQRAVEGIRHGLDPAVIKGES